MLSDRETNIPRPRRRGGALVVSLATVTLLLGCSTGAAEGQGSATGPADSTSEQIAAATPSEPALESESEPAAPVLGVGVEPAHLRVASIGIDEDLVDLGLQPDGTMEVPSDWDRVGWFSGGGRPGGRGPTVMAGHVDSPTQAAVFYRLTELEVGDVVEVTDVEGTLHTYEVYRVADMPKDDYPTHEVFGAVNADELRLITCTGDFDQAQGRHADNRVVFAAAVDV
ncbi:class F sortase [Pseudactinotalea sp.]|uniref:class F sortase n=1 Tax=Pseudactinotalea sp. TaxID=1926260 RepID=UPI003B3A4965